jgi:hypothetical protein
MSDFIPARGPEEDPTQEPRRTPYSFTPSGKVSPVPEAGGGSGGGEETPPSPAEELRQWWKNAAIADLNQILPKISEYTSSDLILMGQFMEHWLGLPAGAGQEAACLFYALGKVARAVSAYKEGRLPSEDTLHDLTVYSMRARRIRETGRWP